MTFKKCKIVMLPTEKAENCILVFNKRGKSFAEYHGNKYFTQDYLQVQECISNHLYIVSDDEIKEGDWIIHFDFNNNFDLITQCTGILRSKLQLTHSECKDYTNLYQPTGQYKKIIATTNKSLLELTDREIDGFSGHLPLPQPSQEFINKYVEEWNKGNKIEWVMVDYEEYMHNTLPDNEENNNIPVYYPKINSKDNTITIRKIKDSWTREEHSNKLKYTIEQAIQYPELFVTGICCDSNKIDKWVEENL